MVERESVCVCGRERERGGKQAKCCGKHPQHCSNRRGAEGRLGRPIGKGGTVGVSLWERGFGFLRPIVRKWEGNLNFAPLGNYVERSVWCACNRQQCQVKLVS